MPGWQVPPGSPWMILALVTRAQNGFCTQIGNAHFAWFGTTDSRSRSNFLTLLRAGHDDYERLVHKLDTFTDEQREAQSRIRGLIWGFYKSLKAYRVTIPRQSRGL